MWFNETNATKGCHIICIVCKNKLVNKCIHLNLNAAELHASMKNIVTRYILVMVFKHGENQNLSKTPITINKLESTNIENTWYCLYLQTSHDSNITWYCLYVHS